MYVVAAMRVSNVLCIRHKLREPFLGLFLGGIGDVAVKAALYKALNEFLEPIRERRAQYEAQPDYVRDVVMEGTRKTRKVADETMRKVREAMKIDYFPGSDLEP